MKLPWLIDRRFVCLVLAWAVISAVVLGITTSCEDSGSGMYQGPSDSEPGWKR